MRLIGSGSNLDEGILSARDFLGKSKDKSVEDASLTSKVEKKLLEKVNEYNNLVHGFGEGGIKWEEFKSKIKKYFEQLKGDKIKALEEILYKMDYTQIGGLYEGLEDLVNRLNNLSSKKLSDFLNFLESKTSILWSDLGLLYGVDEISQEGIANFEGSNTQWVGESESNLSDLSEISEARFNPETFESDVKALFDQLSIKLNLPIYDKYYQNFVATLLEELKTYDVEQQRRFWEDVSRGVKNFMYPLKNNIDEVTEFFRLGSLGAQLNLRLSSAKNRNELSSGKIIAREGPEEPSSQNELAAKLRTYWYKHYVASMFGDIYDGTKMMEIIEKVGKADSFESLDFFNPLVLKWIGDFQLYLSSILNKGKIDFKNNPQDKRIFYNALYATFPYQIDKGFIDIFIANFEGNPDFKNSFFDAFDEIVFDLTGENLDLKEFTNFLAPLVGGKKNFDIVQKLSNYDDIDVDLESNRAERILQKEKIAKLKSIRSFLGLDYLDTQDKAKLENIINKMDIYEIRKLDYLIKISLGDALFDMLPEDEQDMADWLADNIGSIHGRFFEYFMGGLAASDGNLKELGKILSKDSANGILKVILEDDYIKNEFLGYLRNDDNLGDIKLLMSIKELSFSDDKSALNFWHFAKDRGNYNSKDILQYYVESLIGKKVEYDGDLLVYTLSQISPDKSNLEKLFIDYRLQKDARLRHFSKEMSQDEIKKYIFAAYGEEFKKLSSDINGIDTAKLKISADSIQARIGLFKDNELFKKLKKFDNLEEAAYTVQTNYDFYIDRINTSKIKQIEELRSRAADIEVLENYKDKVQAEIDINANWPQDFDKLPSNIDIGYIASGDGINIVVKGQDNGETLIMVKGSNIEEANKKLLSRRAGEVVKVGTVSGQPDDFAKKLKIGLSGSKLSPNDLYKFTSKLSRYVIESFDKLMESQEGKAAFKKLPLEQKARFIELYEQVVNDPTEINDLIRYVDSMISKHNDKTNFFWQARAYLHTDPEKGIIDLGRLNLSDYSTYQTNRFFERKRDNMTKNKGFLGANQVRSFLKSLSNSAS